MSIRSLTAACLCLALCPGASGQTWIDTLPQEIRDSVLWHSDEEEGNLYDWTYPDFQYPGGGIFNTGGDEVEALGSQDLAHSGQYSARATITNAYRAENGNRAVRLMRWTDRPWDDGGDYFPDQAYYSAWYYLPYTYNPNKYPPWDPGDGGWWNVFQFKSGDAQGESQPLWVLNVAHDDDTNQMYFYLYSKYNTPASHGQADPLPIPVAAWFHLEAFYRQSSGNQGRITIWQDGEQILDVPDVHTILVDPAHWGIGNYTDHIAGGPVEGTATVYFDDAVVSTMRVSAALSDIDGGVDAGEDGQDAGMDAGEDAGIDAADEGFDAGADPGSDPGADPGTDPGSDPGTDAGTDVDTPGDVTNCGCGSSPGSTTAWLVLVALLGLARSRK